MQELVARIEAEAEYVGEGIVKMDRFLNHQVDPALTRRMGNEFVKRFKALGIGKITKVVTAEVSGIPAALFTALKLGVPLLYARKHRSLIMLEDYYATITTSRTQGNQAQLLISKRFLTETDRIVIIDDFLATGTTLAALTGLIEESKATLAGIGCVIEKPQENGRQKLQGFDVPIISLAKVGWEENRIHVAA